MRKALFPGSFDPFTLGHKVVVDDALELFDKVIVAVGVNYQKKGLLTPENRIKLVKDIYANNSNVEVVMYEGLTIELCETMDVKFIIRGLRNSVDFEFERNIMQVNQTLHPEVKTVFLFTPPQYVAISSSVVRELYAFSGDTSKFLPEGVELKNYI